ncbi:DivIVA domain-containing protein [Micromonospora sp. LH3U1]|uniref:DivIVA domain-containing protein n=1 Tax=Micromonospora sp. LH3U1 TaxID=3018339 RepID=UPI002349CD80|nr:DivIVA domain-containing protein [Micromonospora sp. LH3U1]WCN82525.1 DivIVA domain-containing protein [Micromonospora sp. LH3U1]
MTVYRSRNALAGPFTPSSVHDVALPRTRLGQRGYQPDDVHALLDRLAFELGERSRQLHQAHAENDRIKNALRAWQTDRVAGC